MSTTAVSPIDNKYSTSNNLGKNENSTRKIVKDEIQRAKKLEEIENKYKSGEISEFEYKASKFLLSITPNDKDIMSKKSHTVFSTTA